MRLAWIFMPGYLIAGEIYDTIRQLYEKGGKE